MPIFSFCRMGCCHQPTTTQTLTRLSFSSAAILILHFLFYKYKHKLRKKEKNVASNVCLCKRWVFVIRNWLMCTKTSASIGFKYVYIGAEEFSEWSEPFSLLWIFNQHRVRERHIYVIPNILALSVCVSESFRGLFQIISNIRIFSVRMPRCWLATTTQMCAMMAAFVPGYTLRNPYFAYSEYKTRFHFHILRALKHKYILSHRKSNQNRNNHNHFNHILWFFEIV